MFWFMENVYQRLGGGYRMRPKAVLSCAPCVESVTFIMILEGRIM